MKKKHEMKIIMYNDSTKKSDYKIFNEKIVIEILNPL